MRFQVIPAEGQPEIRHLCLKGEGTRQLALRPCSQGLGLREERRSLLSCIQPQGCAVSVTVQPMGPPFSVFAAKERTRYPVSNQKGLISVTVLWEEEAQLLGPVQAPVAAPLRCCPQHSARVAGPASSGLGAARLCLPSPRLGRHFSHTGQGLRKNDPRQVANACSPQFSAVPPG